MDRQQGLAEQIEGGFRCFWVVLVCLGGPKHSFLASVSLYGLYSVVCFSRFVHVGGVGVVQ